MTEESIPNVAEAQPETDVAEAVHRVLRASPEPMTVSKIRAMLPRSLREIGLENLTSHLTRQVAANVLWQFPKYRSQQDRFWDRPMSDHLTALVREALREKPLTLAELRRKLPAYAQNQTDAVVQGQLAQGQMFRHPRDGRQGDRVGVQPPDPKTYLRPELTLLFERLSRLGFTAAQLRAGALEMLHEEEWSSLPPTQEASDAAAALDVAPKTEGGLS